MKVKIKDLKFECIIGILPKERVKKQEVILNISFKYKFQKDSKKFIDYSEIARIVEEMMKKKKYFLIEDAILELKSHLNSNFLLKNLKVEIKKPTILDNCVVSVQE